MAARHAARRCKVLPDMPLPLAGKSVFVTDIDGAFGPAIARAVRAAGGRFVAGCRSPAPQEFVGDCIDGDPAAPGDWMRFLDDADRRIGPLTSLVNNPDALVEGSIADLDSAGWRLAQTSVLDAAMLAVRNTLPRLRHVPGSSIVNICSIASEIGLADHSSYCATAFALRPMTRSAAIHAREKGYATRVNCVIAGFDSTGPLAALITKAAVAAEDVAAMVVYLLSDAAKGSTGAEFTVDNGGSVHPA